MFSNRSYDEFFSPYDEYLSNRFANTLEIHGVIQRILHIIYSDDEVHQTGEDCFEMSNNLCKKINSIVYRLDFIEDRNRKQNRNK